MAKSDFINELKALGYNLQEPDSNRVVFELEVPIGKNIGKKIIIGFEVPPDYPMNCPSGPHFKSGSLLDWVEPPNNIHESAPFGEGWRYWSRPFPDWNRIERSAKNYLSHVKNLLANI